ncbi:MAG: MHYT domain-containing protein [Streptosporangiaceae bacterium]
MIQHFEYGPLTPTLAYVMSVIGSFLGLQCALRSRFYHDRRRVAWLVAAAVAIGGTGIWVMHFVAMLGFGVTDLSVRYDVPLTLASALTAIVVVGVGLFIVGYLGSGVLPLSLAGVVTGAGVAGMHYMGMAAMNIGMEISYNPFLVTLSIVIAVVAATVALWAALRAQSTWFTLVAALVMGVAVSGMHYTGMAAMSEHAMAETPPGGAGLFDLIVPLVLGISVLTVLMAGGLLITPEITELREDEQARLEAGDRTGGTVGRPPAR